jgi:hypothetical protein
MRNTMTTQQKTFAIHPPWWILSRGSFWSFIPAMMTARMVKKRKLPRLTLSTASVSNHSRSGVLWKWLIPAGNERNEINPPQCNLHQSNEKKYPHQIEKGRVPLYTHGMDWRRGAATSRSAQEASRESAKRPQ